MRVLLIEDDPMIGKALVRGLSDHGMTVDWVRDGAEGSAALAHDEHALALLDIGLPEMSGIDVLKAARAARGASAGSHHHRARWLDDRIAGLDLGADDYIVKPFELRELLARMRAVRRRHNGHAQSLITSGEITLDLATHRATYRGMEHVLSAREFALLQVLHAASRERFSRERRSNSKFTAGAKKSKAMLSTSSFTPSAGDLTGT